MLGRSDTRQIDQITLSEPERGRHEVISDCRNDTWRAVCTIRFLEAVCVLHVFQKKSKRRIATPKQEIEVIKRRLAEAGRQHREREN